MIDNTVPEKGKGTNDAGWKNEVRMRFKTEMLSIQGAFIVSTHARTNSKLMQPDTPEAKAPASYVRTVIPSSSVRGWLAHGFRSMMLEEGVSPCCTVGLDTIKSRRDETREKYQEELRSGYHHRGSCVKRCVIPPRTPMGDQVVEQTDRGCLFNEIFGGFKVPSVIRTRVLSTTAIKSDRDLLMGRGLGHYRLIHQQATSDVDRSPFFSVTSEALAFVDTILTIDIHGVEDSRRDAIYGALMKTFEYLHQHRLDYNHQFGGKKNSGAGIVECEVLNPQYDNNILDNIAEKEPVLGEDRYLKTSDLEQEEKKSKRASRKDELDVEWLPFRKRCLAAFEEEMKWQQSKYPKPVAKL